MKQLKVKLSKVQDAQTFVNILGAHDGDFKLTYDSPSKSITVDAKSILGVITIISPVFLTLKAPQEFDASHIQQFLAD